MTPRQIRLALATCMLALLAGCGSTPTPISLTSPMPPAPASGPALKQVRYGERIDLDGNAWTIVEAPHLDSGGFVTVTITIGATNSPVPTDTITFVYVDPTGLRTYEQGIRDTVQPGQRTKFDRGWADATVLGGTVEVLQYGHATAVVGN